MRKLAIIGASGHGKVVADIAVRNGYEKIVFFDDDESIKECGGFPVVGKSSDAGKLGLDIIIGIGNTSIRKRIQESLRNENIVTLIHPDAVVANGVSIDIGTVVMAGAVINSGATIGKGCIINTCSSVDHDCIVGDFVHVAVGSHLCGTVTVADKTWVGAGATISNNVSICCSCMIGVGAVVIKNIEETGTYAGVPARKIGIGQIREDT